MHLDTFRALRTPDGQQLLDRACAAYDEKAAVRLATDLRKDYPADLVASALTQAALRRKATAKFGANAAKLYFTRDGLEQATTAAVAAHRAGRLARAEVRRVADLCCGIGGDLLALAAAGLDVTGVDADPLTVELARANLAALGRPGTVELADVEAYDRAGYDAVVADPARRSARGREFDVDAYSPPWPFVVGLLTPQFEGAACVKTAPAIPHPLIPAGVEAEWVSEHGEVKEAALWSGRLGSGVRRRATVLTPPHPESPPGLTPPHPESPPGLTPPHPESPPGLTPPHPESPPGLPADATLTDADDPGDPGEASAVEPGGYLYEPDGAVIRAGLVTALVPLLGGGLPHPRIAYLCSDRLVDTPFATAYEITDVLRFDPKQLRRTLREREVGRLTVKKRGVDVDPETLRRRLIGDGKRSGPNAATLVVTRTQAATVALLVEPR